MIKAIKIKDFENFSISETGIVYDINNDEVYSERSTPLGYVRITLKGKTESRRFLLHRLIADTFIGCVLNLDVHHIDGNKLNNNIDNLMVLTRSEHTKIHSSNMSEETKYKISQKTKGSLNPFFGHKHTIESRKKISENQSDKSGENNVMFGKHHSEEAKQKIRESKKLRTLNNIQRAISLKEQGFSLMDIALTENVRIRTIKKRLKCII